MSEAKWKLVPVEPTQEMNEAFCKAVFVDGTEPLSAVAFGAGYDAALSASPTPPEGGEPVAWLVEWKRGGEDWVNALASEVSAIDDARAHSGTIIPLYAHPSPDTGALREAAEKLLDALGWYGFPVSEGAENALADGGSLEAKAVHLAAIELRTRLNFTKG